MFYGIYDFAKTFFANFVVKNLKKMFEKRHIQKAKLFTIFPKYFHTEAE